MNESVVEEVKARIDLADLVSSYGVSVRHAGGSAKACCPFHHEKTPSFNINVSKGFYHCFGCGESGDAISFVQKMEGLSFVEAVKKLAATCGVEVKDDAKPDPQAALRKRLYALMSELAAFYHRCLLKAKEAEPARAYLKERALDGALADDWLIGYAPNGIANILTWAGKYGYTPQELEAAGVIKAPNRPGDRGYHRFGGRLMFTIRDRQGRVVAFSGRQLVVDKHSGKYVNSPETAIFKKSRVLFGFDKAAANIAKAPHREAIVCEGQIDTIRLHASGFPVALASQGTAFTDEHAKMLRRVADAAVLVFDDDAAGHKATVRTAAILLAAELPVRTVALPDGDDPDSFLRTHPREDFQRLLDAGESIVAFQCRVARAAEAHPDSIDAVARVTKAVLETVAACPNAVLRAGMVGEAAKILSLPAAALTEELAKTKAPKRMAGEPRAEDGEAAFGPLSEDDPRPADGTPSAPEHKNALPPPSPLEMSFLSFLYAHEGEAKLEETVGACLPADVFEHPFAVRFVEAWRIGCTRGEDAFAAFADALDAPARAWFDEVMLSSDRSGASTLGTDDLLQDFVRRLWRARLDRERGALPASDDEETVMLRMRLTNDLKRLNMIKWNAVRDLIREKINGQQGTR